MQCPAQALPPPSRACGRPQSAAAHRCTPSHGPHPCSPPPSSAPPPSASLGSDSPHPAGALTHPNAAAAHEGRARQVAAPDLSPKARAPPPRGRSQTHHPGAFLGRRPWARPGGPCALPRAAAARSSRLNHPQTDCQVCGRRMRPRGARESWAAPGSLLPRSPDFRRDAGWPGVQIDPNASLALSTAVYSPCAPSGPL